jgi:hypothetical protein
MASCTLSLAETSRVTDSEAQVENANEMLNGKFYRAKRSEEDISELKNTRMIANVLATLNKMEIIINMVIRNCRSK